MSSSRPYLIRAFYEWIADNGLTPYITVNANFPDVIVPSESITDGEIVLNVSHKAVRDLRVGNDSLEFKTRFGHKITHVYSPIAAVVAIFAQENGRGMMFSRDEDEGASDAGNTAIDFAPDFAPAEEDVTESNVSKKPHLTLVKADD
ncbi:MAG: ClpXP protease specificity-enhancing factor [Gammaproteobacteria bacterium]|nr:ClpXP protease specificity-enhancing factor [Gammaproteobacteria bacterium]